MKKIALSLIFGGLISVNGYSLERVCTADESDAVATITLENSVITNIKISLNSDNSNREFTDSCTDILPQVEKSLAGEPVENPVKGLEVVVMLVGQLEEMPDAISSCKRTVLIMSGDSLGLFSALSQGDYSCK